MEMWESLIHGLAICQIIDYMNLTPDVPEHLVRSVFRRNRNMLVDKWGVVKVSSKTDWGMAGGFPPVSLCRKRSLYVVVDSMVPGLKDACHNRNYPKCCDFKNISKPKNFFFLDLAP